MKIILSGFLGILLVLSLSSPAFSEKTDRTLDDEIMEELEWLREEAFDMEVVTASRKSQKISDAPATIISITDKEIETWGWRDLKDVFRALPGVDVSYNAGGELKTQVIMRGVAGNQKILILQDGHKYSPATGEPFLYGNNMPLNIYKRIEIIYGPASSLYGADAYAGVINLITKDGADYDGVEMNAGYLSTGAYLGDISFGKKFGDDVDLLISARTVQGEDEKLHNEYNEYAAVNAYSGNLSESDAEYPLKDWNFLLKLRYHKFLVGFDWQHEYESNTGGSRPENYVYTEDFVWGQDMRHFYIDHDTYTGENFSVKTTLELGDYEVNDASSFYLVTGKDENGNPADGVPAYKYASSSYVRGKAQLDWDITEKFSTVWGLSYEKVKSFPRTRNLDAPFNGDGDLLVDMSDFTDPNGYTFGILGFSESAFGERNYYNFGAFIQGEYRFSDKIKLDAGLRYDYNEIYQETFNPRAGLIIDPLENLTIKFLYGTSYIQPANYFRYQNFANAFVMQIPNEDLDPEELTNYSLDVSYSFYRNFFVHGAIYYNKMKNIIRTVVAPAQAGGYPYYNPFREDAGTVLYNGNQGDIISKGGELTLTHRVDRFSNSLSWSYLHTDDEGYDVPGTSEHKITFNSGYSGDKWGAGLTLRYYSDVSTDRNNRDYGNISIGGDGSYAFDGELIAYLNTYYRFTENFSASLGIDNVFDTKHYGGVPSDGSSVVLTRLPQPTRQVYIGFKYRY